MGWLAGALAVVSTLLTTAADTFRKISFANSRRYSGDFCMNSSFVNRLRDPSGFLSSSTAAFAVVSMFVTITPLLSCAARFALAAARRAGIPLVEYVTFLDVFFSSTGLNGSR